MAISGRSTFHNPHPADAARAEEIAARLTKDRQKFTPSRRTETYSETDPCNPASDYPGNIAKIAAAYQELDVALLRQGTGNTAQDLFFADARPGLARFEPEAAISVQRRFARNVTDREGLSRRQGVLTLLPSSAILDSDTVDQLITSSLAATADASDPDSGKRDVWIAAQYALLASLPHKSGNEQLAIIAALPGRSLLVSMLEQLSPADEPSVEQRLEQILQFGDADAHTRVLSFILYSRSPLSARSRRNVSRLLTSADKLVRTQALGIAANLRDGDLLRQVAESGWHAKSHDPKNDYFAIWYGSSALLAAAEAGILDPTDAVDRIAVSFYGFAVRRLGAAGAKTAAARIDAALKRAANLTDIPEFPLVEQPVPVDTDQSPPLLSLVDEPQSSDIRQFFDRMNESDEEFQARQKRAWQAFDRFSRELTAADARIVLDDFSWDGFESVVSLEPTLAKSWATLLEGLPSRTFRSLHFFALGLAKAIAKTDATIASALFRRLFTEAPLINRVVGPSKIPAEAIAVWSSAAVPEIKALCLDRLDRAANDSDLAIEVLAALSAGMQTLIVEYVDGKLAVGEPATNARALMVSGFSDLNPHATKILEQFADQAGFVGLAYRSARYAYERNNWSRQWFEKMKSADNLEDFWRYGVLFTKVVDDRYTLWQSDFGASGEIFQRFFFTIEDLMRNRIKNWKDKRQKALFGQSVPDPIFLSRQTST